MKNLLFLLFVIGLIVEYGGYVLASDLHGADDVQMEPQCVSAGGVCMRSAVCPPGAMSRTQRCSKKGYVCCHGIPLTETRCQKYGGECMGWCNKDLIIHKASDCPPGSRCCLLV